MHARNHKMWFQYQVYQKKILLWKPILSQTLGCIYRRKAWSTFSQIIRKVSFWNCVEKWEFLLYKSYKWEIHGYDAKQANVSPPKGTSHLISMKFNLFYTSEPRFWWIWILHFLLRKCPKMVILWELPTSLLQGHFTLRFAIPNPEIRNLKCNMCLSSSL